MLDTNHLNTTRLHLAVLEVHEHQNKRAGGGGGGGHNAYYAHY